MMQDRTIFVVALLVAPVSIAIVAATGAYLFYCGSAHSNPIPSLSKFNPLKLIKRDTASQAQDEPAPKRMKA